MRIRFLHIAFQRCRDLAAVLLLAGLFAGCVSVAHDDSDIPWNAAPPNDGIPSLPGLTP